MHAINVALYSKEGISKRRQDAAEKANAAQPSISSDLQQSALTLYSERRSKDHRRRAAKNKEAQPSTSGTRRCRLSREFESGR